MPQFEEIFLSNGRYLILRQSLKRPELEMKRRICSSFHLSISVAFCSNGGMRQRKLSTPRKLTTSIIFAYCKFYLGPPGFEPGLAVWNADALDSKKVESEELIQYVKTWIDQFVTNY